MATDLNFTRTFGGLSSVAAPAAAAEPTRRKPDAKTWLNVGIPIEVVETVDGEQVTRIEFITAIGMPLDTADPKKIVGQNADFNARIESGNNILKRLQDVAAELKPGAEHIIGAVGELSFQLRKVNDAPATLAPDAPNKYAVKLPF